jgi:hypothetical protein
MRNGELTMPRGGTMVKSVMIGHVTGAQDRFPREMHRLTKPVDGYDMNAPIT